MDKSTAGHKNTVLLTIAVLAIGMYVLPSTLSMFSGQHTFYEGKNVSCRKCHEDIFNEMSNSPTGTPHLSFGQNCIACHRTGRIIMLPDFGGTLGQRGVNITQNILINGTARINITAHAAVTLECVFCHDKIGNEIIGTNGSHNVFYNSSNQSMLLKGGNEACIGCHSHVMVNITWSRAGGYGIEGNLSDRSWNLSFTLNNTMVNSSTSGS